MRCASATCTRCGHVMAGTLDASWSTAVLTPRGDAQPTPPAITASLAAFAPPAAPLASPGVSESGFSSPDSSAFASARPSAVPSALHEGSGTMRGFLLKQSEHVKQWRRRWFKLDEQLLFYFKTTDRLNLSAGLGDVQIREAEALRKGLLKVGGCIPLQNATVSRVPPEGASGRHFCFMLAPAEGASTQKLFLLCAADDADRDAWIEAIRGSAGASAGGLVAHSGLQVRASGAPTDTSLEARHTRRRAHAHARLTPGPSWTLQGLSELERAVVQQRALAEARSLARQESVHVTRQAETEVQRAQADVARAVETVEAATSRCESQTLARRESRTLIVRFAPPAARRAKRRCGRQRTSAGRRSSSRRREQESTARKRTARAPLCEKSVRFFAGAKAAARARRARDRRAAQPEPPSARGGGDGTDSGRETQLELWHPFV